MLNVNDRVALKIQLKVGRINSQTVDVIDAPALIDESPAVGTTVDRQFVENLPLNGRSFQSLIALTPGVVLVPSSTANKVGQFSVNGQRANANYFTVDGVSANIGNGVALCRDRQRAAHCRALTTFGGTNSLVSVDAIQEFKVLTSTYSAEYGRSPGGQISLVTRRAATNFTAQLFDYFRNDKLRRERLVRQSQAAKRGRPSGRTISAERSVVRFCCRVSAKAVRNRGTTAETKLSSSSRMKD